MRRTAGFLLIVLPLLAACGGSEGPDAPLDRARFERVLAGSLLIQARLTQELPLEETSGSSASAYYGELFEREGVSEADFKATYEAYLQHPGLLKEVYEEVLSQLQQQADSLGQ